MTSKLTHYGDEHLEWDVLHGDDPVDTCVDDARRLPVSLIVLVSHGRSGLV